MGSYNQLTPGIQANKLEIIEKNGQLSRNSEKICAQANASQAAMDEAYLQYDPRIEAIEKIIRTTEESLVAYEINGDEISFPDDDKKITDTQYKIYMDEINDLEEERDREIKKIEDEQNRQETHIQMENEMIQSQVKQLEADTENLESARTDNAKDAGYAKS